MIAPVMASMYVIFKVNERWNSDIRSEYLTAPAAALWVVWGVNFVLESKNEIHAVLVVP